MNSQYNKQYFMITEKMPANVSAICGTLLSVVVSLSAGDLIKSLILGALGTVVSYAVSRVLKAVFE